MRTLSFLIAMAFATDIFAKTKTRQVATLDENQIIATMTEKLTLMPKNKVVFKQKYKVIAEFTKCEKLSEDYRKGIEERMDAHMKSEGGNGNATLAKNFGVLKCRFAEGEKLMTLVRFENAGDSDGELLPNALILSTAEYSSNLDDIDFDDLLGSESLWLFHSTQKSQNT